MSVNYIFLLIFTFVSKSISLTNPQGPTVIIDYSNCISEIIEKEFARNGLMIFANTKTVSHTVLRIRDELLKKVNGQIKYSVEVISPDTEIDACDFSSSISEVFHIDNFVPEPLADYYVIITDTYKDLCHVTSKLIRSRNWNPSAKFIILLLNFQNAESINIRHTENILSCLFQYNVINIIIIVPQAKKVRQATIYTWKPYNPPKYCGYYNETAENRTEVINSCINGKVKTVSNFFENKIPADMKNCVITILALIRQPFTSEYESDANIEKLFFNDVLKKYKIKPDYQMIEGSRGEREVIGHWNGGLEKIAFKHGHILMGGIFPDYDVHEDFEYSLNYLADAYTWVVPKAHKVPAWGSLIIIFKSFVWYSAIATFFLCAVSWRIIGELSKDSVRSSSLDHCFMNSWISTLGFVTYVRPRSEGLRVFYVFLNLYGILFLTAYQTKLFSVLTYPSYEYQIQTVAELIDSGLKFGGYEVLHDLFSNTTDPLDLAVGTRWIKVENITEAMIDVGVHRNFSVLCSRLELQHISAVVPELSDASGDYKYYAFEENTFSVPLETIGLKGFPFMKDFSNTLSLLKQAGVTTMVRSIFKNFNYLRRARLLRLLFENRSDVSPLSLQLLQGGFFALAFGYVGGTLILIIEIFVNSKYFKRTFSSNV